jgi:hypothetical protein
VTFLLNPNPMMLTFENFITCFRKQFIFQIGHGGRRISKYYTAQNAEQGLKNDQWGLMCFIYLGAKYGFSDLQLRDELKIKENLYNFLKEEVENVIKPDYQNKALHKKVVSKIGLVENAIYYTHRVKTDSPVCMVV